MADVKMCEGCGTREVKGPRARFCADRECERVRARTRKRGSRRAARGEKVEPPAPEGKEVPAPAQNVFTATLEELTLAGRVHTAAGQQALKLATRIDYSPTDTGSSFAALGKQHLAALEAATRDVQVADDPVDELAQRRAAHAG